MAIDDLGESPVFSYRSGQPLAIDTTDSTTEQYSHAAKDTDEDQDNEHGQVEEKAKMY